MGVEGGECLWGLVGRWWSENWLPLWITATALEALLWRCGALWGLDGVFCEGALRWVLQEGGKWIYFSSHYLAPLSSWSIAMGAI
jgi:hypothetical protein